MVNRCSNYYHYILSQKSNSNKADTGTKPYLWILTTPNNFLLLHVSSLYHVSWLERCNCLAGISRVFYTAIFSSFSCRSSGLWLLLPKSILLSMGCFSATTFWGFNGAALVLAVLWLLFLAAGTSWLCFPSYVVMTALGSAAALSTCLRTLHPALVHL
jgi:hypothetical protein